ncbi:Putative cytochrome P450 [Septoria linicola]|uniref:Cytochrome P450 n=1 Tax=Septoria linicola TaxID=215465 RepID=A0A9Q9AQ45_9PEZI|nr:Putative cytochrome P450 [Septoria linicola]
MREIYGPIIRPVPEEVHINDPDFLDTIYVLRGRNNPNHPGLIIERSVAGAEDFYLHKMRRDALNPLFNMKFVLQMEDVIGQKCDRAMELTGVKFTKSFGWFVDLVLSFVPAGLRRNAVPSAVLDLIQFKTQAGKDIEALFPDPLTFDPERFMGQSPEVMKRKKCLMAMGKGHRRCLGLNLANAGMALVLARFVSEAGAMKLWETTYEDVEFKHDYQIAHPKVEYQGN